MDISLKSFYVIGIETRTNNLQEMGSHGIIPKQWEKFMKDDLLGKIPHKTDDSVIAAYTDYQSNKDGDYTFFIGARVSSIDNVPEGFVRKLIPPTKYRVLTSEKGPVWQVVLGLWKKIWMMPDPLRAYAFDYEVYDERSMDPQNGVVDIFVSVT